MIDGDSVEIPINPSEGEINLVPSNDQHIVVHGRDGCYLMDKNKWPKLVIPSEVMEIELIEVLTQEESLISDTNKGVGVEVSAPGKGDEHSTDIPEAEDIMGSQFTFSKD
jgi:hypothetical protein